jgi:hypothetical protein
MIRTTFLVLIALGLIGVVGAKLHAAAGKSKLPDKIDRADYFELKANSVLRENIKLQMQKKVDEQIASLNARDREILAKWQMVDGDGIGPDFSIVRKPQPEPSAAPEK